ncbi:CatA-like O-acetyltransferase [Escherichia coli]|uniref:CatA-like O-acetyltransferase n=1 Tax=Escherichia coli TaxID=562 RepID=UPI0038602306
MSGGAFAVTHHAFSSGAGRTSDGNGSHASTLKSPSYTKSVSWQHYQGFIENMFFVSANPWVSFTSFDLNVANMDNFFAPVFTMGKYYTQGDKVLMPLAIQVHHAVCDGFHVGRMLNELQQYCDEWQGGA